MRRYDEREIEAVRKVIESGKLSPFFVSSRGGVELQSFEAEFAEYVGSKNAIAVSNGTTSLEICLRALGVGKGDEVITTPLSFIATATSILNVGATPVFADIAFNDFNVDPFEIANNITNRTKAVIAVSLFGFPCNISEILKAAGSIPVIEDAAQALGANLTNKKIGTFGSFGSFSFQESKTITTLGEGGMIVTDDDELAGRCRQIRNHGNYYGEFDYAVSTNARMTEAQATFGRVQLQKLDEFLKIQTENAEFLINNIELPLASSYVIGAPSYWLIPLHILSEKQNSFKLYCERNGVSLGIPGQNIGIYKKLITHCKIFKPYYRFCRNAEKTINDLIVLDIHKWNKTLENMKHYVEIINGWES